MTRGFKVTELGITGGGIFKTSEGYTILETSTEWLIGWQQPVVYRTKSGHLTAEKLDVCMSVDPSDVTFSVIGPEGARS